MEGTKAMTMTMTMMVMKMRMKMVMLLLAVRGSQCGVRGGGHDLEGRSPSAALLPSGWQRGRWLWLRGLGSGSGGGGLAGSPQHWEVGGTEAGILTQLPVGVVAEPRVVAGFPAEEEG